MSIIVLPVAVVVNMVVSSVALWIAGQITALKMAFKEVAIICVVSGLMWFVPYAGGILALLVFFYLLKQYTDAPMYPDMILVTLITQGIAAMCWYSF